MDSASGSVEFRAAIVVCHANVGEVEFDWNVLEAEFGATVWYGVFIIGLRYSKSCKILNQRDAWY